MDTNIVVLEGRLAAPIEHRSYPSGVEALRFLLTVRNAEPVRRLDVLPVIWWDPPDTFDPGLPVGSRLWVAGSVRRRFWAVEDGRRSRLDLVADQVTKLDGEDAEDPSAEVVPHAR